MTQHEDPDKRVPENDEVVYDRTIQKVETGCRLPEGSIPVRVIEVCEFVDENGTRAAALRWAGTGDILSELGMLDYAGKELYRMRQEEQGGD